MKSLKMMATILVVMAVSTYSFAGTPPDNGEAAEFTTMTFAELKAQYGEASMEILTSLELLDSDLVTISANPCNGEAPCGGALAQARHQAQKLADACCCVQFFGVICCDAGTGGAILAIDGIALPRNNCN
ncbi:MAG: hypothetical protein ACI837_001493 [Crocinitomicaceae bacterium]|jgi:hypothetical protein